jgi:hypothetical protein
MPAQSKFSGFLKKANQTEEVQEAPPTGHSSPTPITRSPQGRGRPRSKSSNPEYSPTTVILRKQTKQAAVMKLMKTEAEEDLSDLIERLLAGWVQAD